MNREMATTVLYVSADLSVNRWKWVIEKDYIKHAYGNAKPSHLRCIFFP